MKKITQLFLIFPFLFLSCSSDDSTEDSSEGTQNTKPEFAMTASINGVDFKANNPFGTNMYSSTNLWDYYPKADYVMLQARQGGILGNPEINIWLKRSDIKIGKYNFSTNQNWTGTHAIDLTDLTSEEFEETKEGTITITEVNTKTKIVKGTFEFTTSADYTDQTVINYTITKGTFNYQYEEVAK